MFILNQTFKTKGIIIQKGIVFKTIPTTGVLSTIPKDFFDHYTPTHYEKKSRKPKTQTKTQTQTIEQIARVAKFK